MRKRLLCVPKNFFLFLNRDRIIENYFHFRKLITNVLWILLSLFDLAALGWAFGLGGAWFIWIKKDNFLKEKWLRGWKRWIANPLYKIYYIKGSNPFFSEFFMINHWNSITMSLAEHSERGMGTDGARSASAAFPRRPIVLLVFGPRLLVAFAQESSPSGCNGLGKRALSGRRRPTHSLRRGAFGAPRDCELLACKRLHKIKEFNKAKPSKKWLRFIKIFL